MSGPLDLSTVADVLAGWLVDELQITRPTAAESVMDPDTGLYPNAVDATIWHGTGAVQPLTGFTQVPDPETQRVLDTTEARHRAVLPLGSAPSVKVGDLLTCRAINGLPGDPKLLGAQFEVVDFGGASTFAVSRILYLRQTGTVDPATLPPVT